MNGMWQITAATPKRHLNKGLKGTYDWLSGLELNSLEFIETPDPEWKETAQWDNLSESFFFFSFHAPNIFEVEGQDSFCNGDSHLRRVVQMYVRETFPLKKRARLLLECFPFEVSSFPFFTFHSDDRGNKSRRGIRRRRLDRRRCEDAAPDGNRGERHTTSKWCNGSRKKLFTDLTL